MGAIISPEQRKIIQTQFLEELRNTRGNLTATCHRCSISRDSFYKWKSRYKKWGKEIERIFAEEKKKLDDYVEGRLLKSIEQGNIAGIIFYLKTRHDQYRLRHFLEMTSKLEIEGKLSPQDKALVEKAVEYGTKEITKENNGKPELPEGTDEE